MVDLNLKVPAIDKLLDYAASGIGAVAGPMLATWKARKEAEALRIKSEAEADSLKLIADAQAEARHTLAAPDEAGRGVLEIDQDGIRQRIEFQERKRQANIASVVGEAAAELGDKEVPDLEPDPDWTARFFDGVQDVSSEDMRKIWAKILSGEVEEPGRTSLRTLDILKNMAKEDALMFGEICNFVVDDFIFFPEEYQSNHPNLSYGKVIFLQETGLVYHSTFLSKVMKFDEQRNSNFFTYQDYFLRIFSKDNRKEVDVPTVLLTGSGRELHRIVERAPQLDYLRAFARFLRENNCELSYAHIVERYPDGRVRHSVPFVPIEPEPEQPGDGAP